MKPITIHRVPLSGAHACQHCGEAIGLGGMAIIISWWQEAQNEFAWYCPACSGAAAIRVWEVLGEDAPVACEKRSEGGR